MKATTHVAAAAVAGLVLQGCSSLPENIETLSQARTAVSSLREEPLAREVARTPFERAQASLATAEAAYEEDAELEVVEHNAYLALRNAQVAEELIAEEQARNELERGEVERTRVLLEAREQEAARAVAAAERAQTQAEQAQALAEQRAQTIAEQTEAAEQAQQRATALEQQLAALEAEETERGLVLTLGDVLFDTAQANLKPGAETTLDRLVTFMTEYPDRRIVVEGHTDSRGSEQYNEQLSEDRADAVRDALVDAGIASTRIEARGLGESYPVASNDSAGGRQLNRRVEIVISDDGGEFRTPPRVAARVGEVDPSARTAN